MSLSTSDVKRIAHLARIEVSEAEAEATLQKLSGILGLIEQMQAVDTTGITPMSHSQDVSQRLRDDVVTATNQRELFQSIAPSVGNGSTEPAVEHGLYLVPKVIE
jgi:aspartyl-tRNA(Asn)/glutamyl-tRNA(Gln) amidotransferase subunit C